MINEKKYGPPPAALLARDSPMITPHRHAANRSAVLVMASLTATASLTAFLSARAEFAIAGVLLFALAVAQAAVAVFVVGGGHV
jgi:hypothetical protein